MLQLVDNQKAHCQMPSQAKLEMAVEHIQKLTDIHSVLIAVALDPVK